MSYGECDVVVILVQFDNPVAQYGFTLVGEQGEAFVETRVKPDFRLFAHLECGIVGEDAELVHIGIVRNLDAGIAGDRLAEAIGSRDTDLIDPSFIQSDGQ